MVGEQMMGQDEVRPVDVPQPQRWRIAGYSSRVVAWLPSALVAVATVAVFATALLLASTFAPERFPTAMFAVPVVVVAALIVPVCVHLGSARFQVSRDAVGIGMGLRGRTRWIPLTAITEGRAVDVDRARAYGLRSPRGERFAVRPGPAVWMSLDNGEHLLVTVQDAGSAASFLTSWREAARGRLRLPATGT